MTPLRFFYLCCFLLALGPGAHAQLPLHYGAMGGISLATQSPGEDGRTGFSLAFFVDYAPLANAAVSFEAAYIQKGQTYRGELTEPTDSTTVVLDEGTFTIALDYASFTLAAKPSISLGEQGLSVYAVAGPRLDVLLREKLIFSGPNESVRFTIEQYEPVVWGYDAGLGVRFGDLLPAPLLAEIRFSGDLSHALNGSADSGLSDTRNQTVQLRLGVEF